MHTTYRLHVVELDYTVNAGLKMTLILSIVVSMATTLGSRGYFFLMDTDGSRRSRVNEAESAEEKRGFIIDKKKNPLEPRVHGNVSLGLFGPTF